MAQITKLKQLFTYRGPGISLPAAVFLGNVDAIYRENSTGTTLVNFKRGSAINAFNTLTDGQAYIVYSNTVPYEIPTSTTTGTPTDNKPLGELKLLSTLFDQ